ncbi:sensor histidine kinase [Phytomonospora endophytica]|uniref:Oxygen sensor histidine kinase NreB n=1 Tax=Phytomonospora endophytica TaxID=714109 RepID=A0A841FQS2_9ACTN|nr:sensor histidine kinase [Phytomonospora endophytica]MBB6036138.1 signal transduction histidine kinase [Phytomonospora endophytica]GIG67041.1 two-component sensor histidine kinase [Phytomonospora endophytica]
MAPAADTAERHAWHRGIGGWHLVYASMAVLAALLIAFDPDARPLERLGRLALLATLTCWYVLTGARALGTEQNGLGLRYICAAVPLTVALYAWTPVGALMFFLLYPHIWALLPTRRAVLASAVVAAGTGIAVVADIGPRGLLMSVGVGAASLAMAWLLGAWISRIVHESERRARLVAELAATRAQLAEASRETGVLAERQRLSRDIHDTVAQGLAAITLLLDLDAEEIRADPDAAHHRVARARETAAGNLAEARALVAALCPPQLRDATLPDAVGALLDRARRDLGVPAGLSVTGEPRPLPVPGETAVLRAAQEALMNIARHARPTTVDVALAYRPDGIVLTVSDDGGGFDTATAAGYGLRGMRERFAALGGGLAVESRPGTGTTVRGELPL